MKYHPFGKSRITAVIAVLLALAFAVACGAAATATPAAKAPAAPAAPKAPEAAAPAAPVTAPTAAPRPTPAPAVAATKPVAERLKVAFTPPAQQTTVGWISARSSGGQMSPMYETLIGTNPITRAPEPMLATEWELSKDAKTFRFKLRKGVPFHTGKEFTAKDVVSSYERMTGPDSIHSAIDAWKKFIKSKDDFEIVNDYEIVLHLGIPGILVPYFSQFPQGNYMYSKDQWEATGGTLKGYFDKPTGTGPYRFREFKEGQHILFERQDKHWRVVPDFKELQIF